MKKKNKTKITEQLNPEMVMKIREIHPKRWERLWQEGFKGKKCVVVHHLVEIYCDIYCFTHIYNNNMN